MGQNKSILTLTLSACTELIRDCNDGIVLKEFSEEAVEACNKLIRRYREHLSRKNSFSLHQRRVYTTFKSKRSSSLKLS